MTPASVFCLANVFRDGGVGSWVLLVYLLSMLSIAWGVAVWQIAAALLCFRSRINANTGKTLQAQANLYEPPEPMHKRSLITLEELNLRKRVLGQ